MELSQEQLDAIQRNRQKALEIQKKLKEKELARKNPELKKSPPPPPVAFNKDGAVHADIITVGNSVRLNKNAEPTENFTKYAPPPIRRADYIEFDLSTMEDSRGGFLNGDHPQEEAVKEMKVVKEDAPPIDLENAPKCRECGSIDLDRNLYDNFNQVQVCRKCAREHPEKYALLTKTECKEDYLLTDPELRDTSLLPRIEKPNPHGYSRMLLFLRFQVEEYAWKKWGSPEGLDKEWERREAMKITRRDKRYNDQLKEMRRKTRAEEYTRKLRNGVGLGERHVHDWSAPLIVDSASRLTKKRCLDCGVETEEYLIG